VLLGSYPIGERHIDGMRFEVLMAVIRRRVVLQNFTDIRRNALRPFSSKEIRRLPGSM
jgi:hypothetical protein